jgi:hypothetical protein
MPIFPNREAEIMALAQALVTGLTAEVADFPSPPVTVIALQAVLDSAQTSIDDSIASRAAAEEATALKNAAIEELIGAMRANLRYAEDAVNYDDAKLTALGWGGKKARTPGDPPGGRRRGELLPHRKPRTPGRRLGDCRHGGRDRSDPRWPRPRQRPRVPRHRRQQSRRKHPEQHRGGGVVRNNDKYCS